MNELSFFKKDNFDIALDQAESYFWINKDKQW